MQAQRRLMVTQDVECRKTLTASLCSLERVVGRWLWDVALGIDTDTLHSLMADEKALRLVTVNLSRVFGTIRKFAVLQRNVDRYRDELKAELEAVKQVLRQTSPAQRNALQDDFEARRMTLASDVSEYAKRQRNEVVEEIRQVIRDKAQERSVDLVLDSGDVSLIGTPAVLFAREGMDMTDEIIRAMDEKA